MPRDDLSIDFVKRMPQAEALDPAIILDDWINRVQNLPEEIRFLQDEIADKDRQFYDCVKLIEDRDAKIQKWIKANGSHETNPREEGMRAQMRENHLRADQLSTEKIGLTQKLQLIMDKHLRNLDQHIKMLYDRAEPGFADPDECPSLLRPSAANISAPSARSINPASHLASTAITATPLNPIVNSASPAAARGGNPQFRNTQTTQHASSAPATPAASMIMNRQARESSAGPGSGAPKRGPRSNSGLGSMPTTSSGLARHSSLGPGTPKGVTITGPGGPVRAGSAGPRSSSTKASSVAGVGRKGTPGAANRKKGSVANGNKSSLSRVKKVGSRNSPASTAESELSDAESASGDDGDRSRADRASGTPARDGKDGDGDESMLDAEDDEAGDDKKYCTCQNVSFGDMVACDNEDCPYEWFHWSCVGLKSEPNGTWFCPVCTENMEKKKK
ncbi:PHD-finger domain-containing protein [Colletotrichum plurivorum]|uniref:Chromatin modification-related protein n=1 Tax=Colletotrichum plurivorum TaxID=2175906 RepID=A0A8H6NPE1_9PEZI|nr:PHD-finger domain-containing protein [Colletotrichum plurivorum]